MLILGMEGSANKLGIAVLNNDEILSNVRDTYVAPTGHGFRPSEITKHHRDNIIRLIKLALEKANKTIKQINVIAYTRGPGMGGALAAVALVAKTLALKLHIPLQPVNHCVAHAEMARSVLKCSNPVILYASGGNTQILGLEKGRYRIFGETLDIAVGNCLDRVARDLQISNDPAPGLNIELLARKWPKRDLIEIFDVPVKGMDLSCAGLNNSVLKRYNELKAQVIAKQCAFLDSIDELKQYVCFSLQECLFASLTEITERAAAHLRATTILCVGGVGCNVRLQEMLKAMAQARGCQFGGMDERFCIDNGAMIGLVGYLQEKAGVPAINAETADVKQRWRTDSVEIKWSQQ